MKLDFEESPECAEWLCDVPLWEFDPFEKGVLTISIEDLDEVEPHLGEFVDDFVQRYRDFWPPIQSQLLKLGCSWSELKAAHKSSRIELNDGLANPPAAWDLTFCFIFSNGHMLSMSLSFEGWEPDDHLVGSH